MASNTETTASDESNDETTTDDESDVNGEVNDHTQVIEAGVLQDTMSFPSTLVNEAKIHFDESGLGVRAVDPANVGMIDLSLSADAFEVYNSYDSVLGLNLVKFTNIISMADSDTLVTMFLNPNTQKLEVSFDGLQYTLALLDPNSIREEPDVPDNAMPVNITTEAREITRGLDAANMVSEHITLSADYTNVFRIEAQGDTDNVEVELTEDDYIDFTADDDASSLFSLDYLRDMLNPVSKDMPLSIKFGNDYPVTIHFEFVEGDGQTTYVLAPRIQN